MFVPSFPFIRSPKIMIRQTKSVKMASLTCLPLRWRTSRSQMSSLKTRSPALQQKPPPTPQQWSQVRLNRFPFLAAASSCFMSCLWPLNAASHLISSPSCKCCPTGNNDQKYSLPSSEDHKVPRNKSQGTAITSDSSTPSSGWTKEIMTTASNTLSDSLYKSFTTSSLLRVLVHTTQPLFNGKTLRNTFC